MNICDIIYKSTVVKSDINKLIHKTYYTNMKENYGTICLHGTTVSLENIGIGEEEHIPLSKMRFSGCSGKAQKLADIHTHPSRNLFMSEGDILDSFRRGLDSECIAVESEFKENRVRCYTLKSEHKSKRIYVDNLKKEIEQIVKQVHDADKKAFKAIFTRNERLISKTKNTENKIKDKYHSKARELSKLMEDSLNWFDYCDLDMKGD